LIIDDIYEELDIDRSDIHKVIDTFLSELEIQKYSRMVSIEEIADRTSENAMALFQINNI
jgi:hypothetical protein